MTLCQWVWYTVCSMCLIFSTVLCFAHCTVQLPLTAFSLTLCTWHIVTSYLIAQISDVPVWTFYPNVDWLCCSPTSLCSRPVHLSRAFACSFSNHIFILPSVSVSPYICVCCVCVLRVQIPTGPLIFNPLQQPQLSQFSPQQSQSATSSPQQQGETVRHTFTVESWSHIRQPPFQN